MALKLDGALPIYPIKRERPHLSYQKDKSEHPRIVVNLQPRVLSF